VAGADAEREAVAEAVRAREAEVERAPGDPEAHFQLGLALCDHVHHVGVLDKLGVARRLREELEAAVGLDPAHVGARIALIEFHRQAPPIAGGRPDEVRRHAEELLALEPVEGRLALARMLRKYGEPRAAERHVRQVLGVDPTHRDALLLLARLAEDVGRLEEARVVLAALLLVSPDDDEARLLLADLAAASTGCPGSPASD
jgi:tetratricopeptide (TPR) repeat protein